MPQPAELKSALALQKEKKKKQGEITQQAGVPGLTFTYSTDTKYPRQGRDAQARTH